MQGTNNPTDSFPPVDHVARLSAKFDSLPLQEKSRGRAMGPWDAHVLEQPSSQSQESRGLLQCVSKRNVSSADFSDVLAVGVGR